MKEKNIKTQENISKQRHAEKIKISLKVRTPNTKVSCFSKWYLVRKGKRDGKKSIPYLDGMGNWISPTIQEECNKVDILISNVYRYLCKNNLLELCDNKCIYIATIVYMQLNAHATI